MKKGKLLVKEKSKIVFDKEEYFKRYKGDVAERYFWYEENSLSVAWDWKGKQLPGGAYELSRVEIFENGDKRRCILKFQDKKEADDFRREEKEAYGLAAETLLGGFNGEHFYDVLDTFKRIGNSGAGVFPLMIHAYEKLEGDAEQRRWWRDGRESSFGTEFRRERFMPPLTPEMQGPF